MTYKLSLTCFVLAKMKITLSPLLFLCTVEGSDYTTPNPFNVVFNIGDPATLCVPVSIIDDTVLEGDHDFSVFIPSAGASATIGTPDTTVITITDNECK